MTTTKTMKQKRNNNQTAISNRVCD
jgi:hypothetical protein